MTVDGVYAPRLAIVVPIFQHAVLVAEAVCSALDQKADFDVHVVLVNDGCRMMETHAVCMDFARAYPNRVTYLRKANGGLSDARNHGIRHILRHLPSVEAIYMLDADNRLRPGCLARMMDALDTHPDAAWIYPDIDMFGLRWQFDYGGPYSLLIQTAMNVCEAGSLIRRTIFESGVLYDTGFKLGWEDWDFYLAAAEAGFRGRNEEFFGFQYRKRPESMLADSERDQGALQAAMRAKHKALMHPRALTRLEHEECPRYAIVLTDEGEVLLCTDPLASDPRRVGIAEFIRLFWSSILAPGRISRPPYVFVTSSTALRGLQEAGMIHWTLWRLEVELTQTQITILEYGVEAEDRIGFATATDGRSSRKSAIAFGVTAKLLQEVTLNAHSSWIDTLLSVHCEPTMSALKLLLPAQLSASGNMGGQTAIYDFLSLVHRLRDSECREAQIYKPEWRTIGIEYRERSVSIVRKSFDGSPGLPWLADERCHVAFLLPLVEFGGVEKVALQMARSLRSQGLVPHIVVIGATSAALTTEWRTVFESIHFLDDQQFSAWAGGPQNFFGTNVPRWAEAGPHGPALGLLHRYDALINFHGGAIAGVFGQLRRLGVRTVQSLHLNDLTPLGRPAGNTYLALAYEHAVDIFAPCSQRLADWLHAMGVPTAKICLVLNAPGFDSEPTLQARGRAERLRRTADDSLRVLYLGRLDRQKGLDRLAAVVGRTRTERMNVTWRVLGKALMGHDAPPLPAVLAQMVEAPVMTALELTAAYAWADVVVLLSSYEGLPLTVLEAMRAGAVMIATDVGATTEVLHDGENGIVVPLASAAEACVLALRKLKYDRVFLARLSLAAARSADDHSWARATAGLAEAIISK